MEIAKESNAVLRARAKLEKLVQEQEKITENKLQETKQKIRDYLANNQTNRVDVPEKPLGLFAHNVNAAPESHTVQKIRALCEQHH